MVVWGRLSDKLQLRRTLIIVGELCAALGTVVLWYLHIHAKTKQGAGYIVILGLSAIEIFWSMSNIGWSALLSDSYTAKERSAIQGKLASIGGLSRIIGIWCGGVLYDGFGKQYEGWGFYEGWLFHISAAAMVLSTIPLFFIHEGGINISSNVQEEKNANLHESTVVRYFFIFLGAMIFINFGRNALAITRSQYLVLAEGFNLSTNMVGYLMNAESGAMICTGFTIAYFKKKMGDQKILVLGSVLAIVSIFLFGMGKSLVVLYISNFIRGCSEVLIMASSYTFASLLIPVKKRAKFFSYFNATFFLSWGLGATFISGPIIDYCIRFGFNTLVAYQISFYTSACLVIFGFAILIPLIYTMKKDYVLSPAMGIV